MITRTLTLCLVVVMLAGVAQAAPTHSTTAGLAAGGITDLTSQFVANGEPSSTDLLEGATGVFDPLPAGPGPCLLGSETEKLVDGLMYGYYEGNPVSSSSTRNGWFMCTCSGGTGSVTYTGLGGVEIGKISLYHGNSWTGDMDLEVYVDTGSGFSLLYATGFIDKPRGEYRLDIFDDTSLTVPLATGVVGLKLVVDASAATDFVYMWELDALPVPLVVVEPTAVEATEAGAPATVTITPTQQPTADVTITATPSGANVFDYYLDTADPNDPVDLVFTSADWAPKTLTITAVDDFEVEAAFEEALVALSISTSDPCYVDYPLPDIAVDVLDNDAGAAHAYVAGRLVGTVNDATSLFFPIGQPSAGDLLEGATGVLDPAPAGSGPVLLGSDASDLVDGELYGDEALPTRSFSSSANGLFICNSCGDGIGTVTYTGLGGVDIAKISIYAGNAWTGDMDVAVYADNGSGFTLLYATGFIDAPRGEYRLDISSLGGPMQTLATGVVGLKFVFDVSAATDFVYIWEIDAFAVPTIQVSPDSTAVVEGGATDTIDFELLAEPADDVTIDFTVDAAQLTVTPNPLVIPKADWATPLSVTVEAVDDEVLEGDPHTSPLKWFIDDADPNTGGRWVEIGENDCGAWGYLQMDFNTDCTVDLEDLAAFAAQYLFCTRPNDEDCLDLR